LISDPYFKQRKIKSIALNGLASQNIASDRSQSTNPLSHSLREGHIQKTQKTFTSTDNAGREIHVDDYDTSE